jgi:hypothetical protein
VSRIFVARKTTVPSTSYPSFSAIKSTWEQARDAYLNAISRPGTPAEGIQWVGPEPRVTRVSDAAVKTTTVVWPFSIPDGVPDAQAVAYARRFVNGERLSGDLTGIDTGLGRFVSLDATVETEIPITTWDRYTPGNAEIGSSWEVATVAPYNETINGPLSFWQSGRAAQTMTREEPRALDAIVNAHQNPIGPDTPETTPKGIPGALDQLKPVLIIAAVIAGSLALASVASSFKEVAAPVTAKFARKNPHRKRRR